MWTDTTRAQHARKDLALPSDMTDVEWSLLEPLLPQPCHVGRPRKWPMRRIVEAMFYLLRGGLPWRMMPPGLSASNYGAALFLRLARRCHMGADQSLSLAGRAYGTGQRSLSQCRCDRQPVG